MGRSLRVIESRSAVPQALPTRPDGWGEGGLPPLVDARDRRYTYVRLSVTDRCDLACVYCMPPGGEEEHGLRDELLSFEEAARLVGVLAASGIGRVRFTGGEPLVRKDVVELVARVKRSSDALELAMTTNGTRLAELAQPLAKAGLRSVNVSVDSLDDQRFFALTRGGDLKRVLAGIHAALDAGLEVKLNTVAMAGANDDEFTRIVDYAWSLGVTPRFIELMPLGEAAHLPRERFLSTEEIVERLSPRVAKRPAHGIDGRGPARYLEAADGSGRTVGFISAVSDEFCGTCNRIRITARGDLRACLASRKAVSLRDRMRDGASDADLAWAVHAALGTKETGHFFLDAGVEEHTRVGMSLIGG